MLGRRVSSQLLAHNSLHPQTSGGESIHVQVRKTVAVCSRDALCGDQIVPALLLRPTACLAAFLFSLSLSFSIALSLVATTTQFRIQRWVTKLLHTMYSGQTPQGSLLGVCSIQYSCTNRDMLRHCMNLRLPRDHPFWCSMDK